MNAPLYSRILQTAMIHSGITAPAASLNLVCRNIIRSAAFMEASLSMKAAAWYFVTGRCRNIPCCRNTGSGVCLNLPVSAGPCGKFPLPTATPPSLWNAWYKPSISKRILLPLCRWKAAKMRLCKDYGLLTRPAAS